MPEKIILAWSGGKDSNMALHVLQQQTDEYEIVSLLSTVTEGYARVSMHGVRRALIRQQAESLGLPLYEVWLTQNSSNEEYDTRMTAAVRHFQLQGVRATAFGDLFLEDVRNYRIKNLARVGNMRGLFPLWQRDTTQLVHDFIELGFKARICTCDPRMLDPSFCGRVIDEQFLADLPDGVDPAGENGEFHSFVYDGPNFSQPIPIEVAEPIEREGFIYCDLIPA